MVCGVLWNNYCITLVSYLNILFVYISFDVMCVFMSVIYVETLEEII